jgi:hypothetical protein
MGEIMSQTNESRRQLVEQLQGASMSLRLLLEGLQRMLPREAIDRDAKTRLRQVFAAIQAASEDLALLSREVAGGDDSDTGLRDTRIGP